MRQFLTDLATGQNVAASTQNQALVTVLSVCLHERVLKQPLNPDRGGCGPAWCLPFKIEPLGGASRMVSPEDAKKRWPVVRNRLGAQGGVSAIMNITGTTVFVPVVITPEDREIICGDLADRER